MQQKPQHDYKLGNTPVTFVRAAKVQSPPAVNPQQNLDEITNKVFNELLQGKVEEGGVNGVDQGSVKV